MLKLISWIWPRRRVADPTPEPADVPACPAEQKASVSTPAIVPPAPPPASRRQVKRRISVGRLPSSDIVVDDPGVSRTHMYILLYEKEPEVATLLDTRSLNGIQLLRNGEFIQVEGETDVSLDDVIKLGGKQTTVRKLLRGGAETPDIFISYAREDEGLAKEVETLFRAEGWRVWRDNRLGVARSFDEEIEHYLTSARCVVVLWTAHSVASKWVRAEASVALDRGVLVPVLSADVVPPVLFRQIQGVKLTSIDAADAAQQRRLLVEKIAQLIGHEHEGTRMVRYSD